MPYLLEESIRMFQCLFPFNRVPQTRLNAFSVLKSPIWIFQVVKFEKLIIKGVCKAG